MKKILFFFLKLSVSAMISVIILTIIFLATTFAYYNLFYHKYQNLTHDDRDRLWETNFRIILSEAGFGIPFRIDPDEVLKDEGEPYMQYFAKTDQASSIPLMEMMLRYGSNINFVDRNDFTPLIKAVSFRNVEHVDFLLAHGARADLINRKGQSAIFYLGAIEWRWAEAWKQLKIKPDSARDIVILDHLLAAGAKPCQRDNSGQPAHAMIPPSLPVWERLIEACQERGGIMQ